ncbi:hypothetical protein BKA70DRAFT_1574569 [Coprinopsis sp. MPI-PUGE-AT-0042]|nr:hypothetical protein BKA70DRAFT_1574569 [Coprinopsis sp. MPI-PUGE-AT-0042]
MGRITLPPAMKPLQVIPYLGNNEPLPDHLHRPFSIYLDYLASNIDALEGRETSLKRELWQLQEKLATEREESNRFSNLPLRAIRRVPTEIIAAILQLASEDSMHLNHTGRIRFAELRSICSLWCHAAFSAPNLWKGLRISKEGINAGAMYRATQKRKCCSWFARAGSSGQRLVIAQKPDVFDLQEIGSFLESPPGLL